MTPEVRAAEGRMRDDTADSDASLFTRLDLGAVHRTWAPTMSRAFVDPDACELCCHGWCMQRLVVRPGSTLAVVVHGLALH